MAGRGGEGGGARVGEGGGRDEHGVANITKDLLRGAENPPMHRSNGSFVLKSLFRNNAKSVAENVVKILVRKDKERSLILKEKNDQISNLENTMNVLKQELSKAEHSKILLETGLNDEKSSKLSLSKLCNNLTLEVGCLKKEVESVTGNANFVMNEVVKEKENEIKLKDELIFDLTKQLKLKEESANSAAEEHRKEIEDLIKESNHFDSIGNAVKNRQERELREARKETVDAKSALDSKNEEFKLLGKEVEVLRKEKSCTARDFSRMSNQQLKTKSALELKTKEIELLKTEKEKEIELLKAEKAKEVELLKAEKEKETKALLNENNRNGRRQLKINFALEKEIALLKVEKEKEIELLRVENEKGLKVLRDGKEKEIEMLKAGKEKEVEALLKEKEMEIEVLRAEKSLNAEDFSSMSNKVLAALEKEKKENKQLRIRNLKQDEETALVSKQKELVQEIAADLKTNNEKQKEEIAKLLKQKAFFQALVVELEAVKEKQIAEMKNVAAQVVFVEASAAEREEKLSTQGDQIAKLQTLKKSYQAKIHSLDQSNLSLRRKIVLQMNWRKEEKKKDKKAFTGLVLNLKAKLRRQVHHSKHLKTQFMSKREDKTDKPDKLGELVSLQELNKDLFSGGSREGTNTSGGTESQKENHSPPTASGSKKEEILSGESSLGVFELENAAEEHNLGIAYSVLGPTMVEVVLRGIEGGGDCKRMVGRGRGVREAQMEVARMALAFLTRFDQGKDDFDEVPM